MRTFVLSSIFAATLLGASARAQLPCYAAYDGPVFDDVAIVGGPWLAFQFVMPTSVHVLASATASHERQNSGVMPVYVGFR